MRHVGAFRRLAVCSGLFTLGLTMLPAAVQAQSNGVLNVGKQLYQQYCSACHGPEGKGDGVVSGFLTPKPTDLTLLAKQHGGTFPFANVMRSIDGSANIRAHGDPTMPVWGETLRYDPAQLFNKRVRVQGTIALITQYIASVQQQ